MFFRKSAPPCAVWTTPIEPLGPTVPGLRSGPRGIERQKKRDQLSGFHRILSHWGGLCLLLLATFGCNLATSGEPPGGKPNAASSTVAPSVSADWCAGHAVPESKCTLCNPELIPGFQKAGDWCEEHQLPESVCPQCNPGPAAHMAESGRDWCAGHGVPESKCTLCHPELIVKFQERGDWCEEHRLPESVCPQCNPGPAAHMAESGSDWCAGHGVPESKCTLCHPELIAKFQEKGDWCEEHRLPESVCPTCNPQNLNDVPLEQRIVRFLSPEKEIQAGIRTVPVQRGAGTSKITAPARIEYSADGMADLRTVVPGVVQVMHVPIGEKVEAGQALFELRSPEIGQAQVQLRNARARARVAEMNLKRQQSLVERLIASPWDVEQAEIELESAQAQVAAAESTLQIAGAWENGPPGMLTVRAPITGKLVHREAILGTLADEETSLGMIADTEHLWAICDLPESQIKDVKEGAVLLFHSDDGQEARGEIVWMATEVDTKTRTIAVRAQICNHEGIFRVHQFGRATISTQQGEDAWLVPAASVQRIDHRSVVFVRREPGTYQPREVVVLGSGDTVPVRGRLSLNEQVVTTGAVLLRTEMLPGSIGAGCCEVEQLGAQGEKR